MLYFLSAANHEMTKNIFLLLSAAAVLSFTACSADEETQYPASKPEKMAWKVDVRSQTGESVNTDAADKEDQVDNVILAGSPYVSTLTGKSFDVATGGTNTAVFNVESFLGKKDFFFAANLKADDAERMGISGVETDFNKLEFNTKDYIRGFFGNDAKKPIPMSAALRDVESPTNAVSGLTSLSKSEVKLERLFARIDIVPRAEDGGYNFGFLPYEFTITGIRLLNVPAKFSVGGPIANYDLKHKASATDYPYLDPIQLPLGTPTVNNSIKTYPTISVYLPENYVSHPVFGAQDLNGMTYLEITYTARWTTNQLGKELVDQEGYPEPKSGKCYFRIGAGGNNTPHYGQIRRNAVYTCYFTLGESFRNRRGNYIQIEGRVIN
jgi:hypothetical protein